nr:retrovirus-related Pol polyprotein from transposon TNT 1-94 [Tanacetum cinerariifolium]
MKGTEMTKQERESMLYDEFDKFTSEPGESIHSYYLRFTKLINDMKMIPMTMSPMQINMKFVNHLQPERSRFITAAKQVSDLHNVTFNQLYTFLRHNERCSRSLRNATMILGTTCFVGANQPRVIRCYNCNGEGHMAKKCTVRKRVKYFKWCKEKILLAQEKEARVVFVTFLNF